MKRLLLALAVLAAAGFLLTRWPLVDQAERSRDYGVSEERAAQAAKAAVERLSRWRFVGAGSGAGGRALQAVYTTLPGLEHDVDVRVRKEGALARVRVKSKSRVGPIDFGQNARLAEELLAALDGELAR